MGVALDIEEGGAFIAKGAGPVVAVAALGKFMGTGFGNGGGAIACAADGA